MPPVANVSEAALVPSRPPSNWLSPPVSALVNPAATGLNACATASPETRSASDCSTVSNCLPPAVACVNAFVIALAKLLALEARLLVLAWSPPSNADRSLPDAIVSLASNVLSAIGISLHQSCQRGAVDGCCAPGRRLDRIGKLARRHAPELLRGKTQNPDAEADCLFPRKRRHAASPNVAAIRSAAMRT